MRFPFDILLIFEKLVSPQNIFDSRVNRKSSRIFNKDVKTVHNIAVRILGVDKRVQGVWQFFLLSSSFNDRKL